MATPEIEAAIAAIPSKLADLRKSHQQLQSFSSSLVSFNLKWQDLESHFANLQKSIDLRLQLLKSKSKSTSEPIATSAITTTTTLATDNNVTARPELLFFCQTMDGAGLISYIVTKRDDINTIRNELGAALASAPDPPRLVIDALDGFKKEKGKGEKDGDSQVIRRTCLNLLEQLRGLGPEVEISDSVREMAKKIGEGWLKSILKDGVVGENGVEALAFFELLSAYRLVGEFDKDDVLDVFVIISRRKQALDYCENLGLGEHMPDLIVKLSNKGRLVDAVKLVQHLNLADKFPPVPLLKEYVKDAKKNAQEIRDKGNNSKQSKNEATAKELSALKAVVRAIQDYNLQSQYPCDELNKRITQLEQQKANKKRPAPTAAANASHIKARRQQPQQPPNKRSRPMVSMPSSQYGVASHPPPALTHIQSHAQLGMIEQPQYQGLHYGLARTGAPYDAAVSVMPGAHYALGRTQSPPHPRSHLYSSESLLGTGNYDMPVAYGNYASSSNASVYARGI